MPISRGSPMKKRRVSRPLRIRSRQAYVFARPTSNGSPRGATIRAASVEATRRPSTATGTACRVSRGLLPPDRGANRFSASHGRQRDDPAIDQRARLLPGSLFLATNSEKTRWAHTGSKGKRAVLRLRMPRLNSTTVCHVHAWRGTAPSGSSPLRVLGTPCPARGKPSCRRHRFPGASIACA